MSLAERLAQSGRPDRMAEVRTRVQASLVESLGPKLYDLSLTENELRELVHQHLRELLDEEEITLSVQEKAQVIQQIGDSILGLGPLEPYVRDPEVTEIMVNGPESIYVERLGKPHWTGARFFAEGPLPRALDKNVRPIGR